MCYPKGEVWFILLSSIAICIAFNQAGSRDSEQDNITMILTRIRPRFVGEQIRKEIVPWIIHTLKVLSLKPPVFEVENFLTDAECEYLIKQALEEGLQTSRIVGETGNITEELLSSPPYSDFQSWDIDDDGLVSFDETSLVFVEEFGVSIADCTLDSLGLDHNKDGKITEAEFHNRNIRTLVDFITANATMSANLKVRESDQAWIRRSKDSKHKIMESIEKRLAKTTGLPLSLIQSTEEMQVVRYHYGGHYNCHLDSDDINRSMEWPCCHISPVEECRICRYLTALYYLNDVAEGGETAFPIAESADATTAWRKKSIDLCDLTKYCKEASLRVMPRKGKLVFWYNHQVDPSTQWMGQIDLFSYHGGCQVVKGTKWIANHWVDVSTDREEDKKHWKSF